jgi:hypothetical protein
MTWHKLIVNPLDGPLDPDEMAGGYEDDPCYHQFTTTLDFDEICDECGERIV